MTTNASKKYFGMNLSSRDNAQGIMNFSDLENQENHKRRAKFATNPHSDLFSENMVTSKKHVTIEIESEEDEEIGLGNPFNGIIDITLNMKKVKEELSI